MEYDHAKHAGTLSFSEITDFLATTSTPQEIIAYQLSEDLQARVQ